MGGREIRGLKAREGQECYNSRGGQVGQIEQWRNTSWRSPKRKTQCW